MRSFTKKLLPVSRRPMRTITGPLFSSGLKLMDRISNFPNSKFMIVLFWFYSCIVSICIYIWVWHYGIKKKFYLNSLNTFKYAKMRNTWIIIELFVHHPHQGLRETFSGGDPPHCKLHGWKHWSSFKLPLEQFEIDCRQERQSENE